MNLSDVLELLAILSVLLPVLIKLMALIGHYTSNVRMKTIAERAMIIVAALEDTPLLGEDRYAVAHNRLAYYANEVGISVTPEQIEDHIEGALTLLRKGIAAKK